MSADVSSLHNKARIHTFIGRMALRVATKPGSASESEDDLAAVAAISSAENRRATLNTLKSTKFKKAMRRASTGKAATKRKAAAPVKQSRAALKDRTNLQNGSDTEEVEDFEQDEMEVEEKPKAKRARATATKKKAPARAASEPVDDAKPAAKRTRMTKRAPSAEPMRVIPETQQDPDQMDDISQSIEGADMAPEPALYHAPPRQRSTSVQPLQPRASARSASVQAGYPAPRERSGSVSGTERERRGGDPELRRKLNEMTRKHENLSLKYQNLQALGKDSAESNFEKLKRASDEKAKSANELIASLKKELAEARKGNKADVSESAGLHKQIDSLTKTNDKLSSENKELKNKAQIAQSDAKAAQNEVKSLEAKLIAARQQVTEAAQEKKANGAANSRNMPANASEAQKEAKMKENLYSDLTGLLIRNVKRKEGEDEFDCLQTGRNGSKSSFRTCSSLCAVLTITSQLSTSTSQSQTTPAPRTRRHPPANRTRKPSSHTSLCWTNREMASS